MNYICPTIRAALLSDIALLHNDSDFERLAAIESKIKLIPRGRGREYDEEFGT